MREQVRPVRGRDEEGDDDDEGEAEVRRKRQRKRLKTEMDGKGDEKDHEKGEKDEKGEIHVLEEWRRSAGAGVITAGGGEHDSEGEVHDRRVDDQQRRPRAPAANVVGVDRGGGVGVVARRALVGAVADRRRRVGRGRCSCR